MRRLLFALLLIALPAAAQGPAYAPVRPGVALTFPAGHGAHPAFRTEWWYVTGFANVQGQEAALGFQITFFRRRLASTQAMTSNLAAKQLLFAHAAVSDVQGKTLWSDQRIARWSGVPDGANASDQGWARLTDTGVVLRDWSLQRIAQGALRALVIAADFSFDLTLTDTQPVLPQRARCGAVQQLLQPPADAGAR